MIQMRCLRELYAHLHGSKSTIHIEEPCEWKQWMLRVYITPIFAQPVPTPMCHGSKKRNPMSIYLKYIFQHRFSLRLSHAPTYPTYYSQPCENSMLTVLTFAYFFFNNKIPLRWTVVIQLNNCEKYAASWI